MATGVCSGLNILLKKELLILQISFKSLIHFGRVGFTALLFFMCLPSGLTASPAACDRNAAAMFHASDAVVEAVVTSSRRWQSSRTTIHLVGKYQILDVWKGALHADDVIIATDTCLDEPIPDEFLGYPVVGRYCMEGRNLTLTGVRSEDGQPLGPSENFPGWILFLQQDYRKGAPEQTWKEVSRTGYSGSCFMTSTDLPAVDRDAFRRLLESRPSLNSLGHLQ